MGSHNSLGDLHHKCAAKSKTIWRINNFLLVSKIAIYDKTIKDDSLKHKFHDLNASFCGLNKCSEIQKQTTIMNQNLLGWCANNANSVF